MTETREAWSWECQVLGTVFDGQRIHRADHRFWRAGTRWANPAESLVGSVLTELPLKSYISRLLTHSRKAQKLARRAICRPALTVA